MVDKKIDLDLFQHIFYKERFSIKGIRASAMCLSEAYYDMEVTYVKNKNIVDKIRGGDFNALNILRGLMLKHGENLIHPEYVDYYFGWKFNLNGDDDIFL